MKGELPALCIDWRHLLVSTACRAVTAMEGGQGGVSAYAVFRWRIVCDCNQSGPVVQQIARSHRRRSQSPTINPSVAQRGLWCAAGAARLHIAGAM